MLWLKLHCMGTDELTTSQVCTEGSHLLSICRAHATSGSLCMCPVSSQVRMLIS